MGWQMLDTLKLYAGEDVPAPTGGRDSHIAGMVDKKRPAVHRKRIAHERRCALDRARLIIIKDINIRVNVRVVQVFVPEGLIGDMPVGLKDLPKNRVGVL